MLYNNVNNFFRKFFDLPFFQERQEHPYHSTLLLNSCQKVLWLTFLSRKVRISLSFSTPTKFLPGSSLAYLSFKKGKSTSIVQRSQQTPAGSSLAYLSFKKGKSTPSAEWQICALYFPASFGKAARYSRSTFSRIPLSYAGSISAIQQPLKPAPEKRPP